MCVTVSVSHHNMKISVSVLWRWRCNDVATERKQNPLLSIFHIIGYGYFGAVIFRYHIERTKYAQEAFIIQCEWHIFHIKFYLVRILFALLAMEWEN